MSDDYVPPLPNPQPRPDSTSVGDCPVGVEDSAVTKVAGVTTATARVGFAGVEEYLVDEFTLVPITTIAWLVPQPGDLLMLNIRRWATERLVNHKWLFLVNRETGEVGQGQTYILTHAIHLGVEWARVRFYYPGEI